VGEKQSIKGALFILASRDGGFWVDTQKLDPKTGAVTAVFLTKVSEQGVREKSYALPVVKSTEFFPYLSPGSPPPGVEGPYWLDTQEDQFGRFWFSFTMDDGLYAGSVAPLKAK